MVLIFYVGQLALLLNFKYSEFTQLASWYKLIDKFKLNKKLSMLKIVKCNFV